MTKSKLPKTGDEIEALRISLALCGIAASSQTTCLILEIFKKVQKVGGKFNIEDAVNIQYDVEKRYNRKEVVATKNPVKYKPIEP